MVKFKFQVTFPAQLDIVSLDLRMNFTKGGMKLMGTINAPLQKLSI